MKNKICPIACLGFTVLLATLTGCGLAPVAVERHFYTIVTNTTPTVTAQAVTNGNAVTLTYTTNFQTSYTYTPNVTNAAPAVATVRAVGNVFGPFGELAAGIVTGLLALWGIVRSRHATKAQAASAVLAQGIETLREILKTTPQGQELDAKIVALLTKQQITAGVIREVAGLVNNNVDNEAARAAARALLERLPA